MEAVLAAENIGERGSSARAGVARVLYAVAAVMAALVLLRGWNPWAAEVVVVGAAVVHAEASSRTCVLKACRPRSSAAVRVKSLLIVLVPSLGIGAACWAVAGAIYHTYTQERASTLTLLVPLRLWLGSMPGKAEGSGAGGQS